jgi:N-acetylglutamate synthase-like GNAT family acetyltransferase
MNGFSVSTEHKDLDFEFIYAFISDSYWAKGIPQDVLRKAIDNSLVFGVYTACGNQVGFARVVTDKATFAYLADVFIDESHQGLGLGRLLMDNIASHPDLQGVRRFMLATRDAHGLYEKYGFKPVENPEILMQIWDPNIYQSV